MKEQEYAQIRAAYYVDNKSIRAIARETGHSRKTISRVISEDVVQPYRLTTSRPAPVFGPYQTHVEELLNLNEHLPRKQHYTVRKIFQILQVEGYQGCESRISQYRAEWSKRQCVFDDAISVKFEPGRDAQCEWEEAETIIGGVRQTIQVFVCKLSYSNRLFVMAFPSQKQENFFYGHVCAFKHFEGVPWRIRYNNFTKAKAMVRGQGRWQQQKLLSFCSHYLFKAHFSRPSKEHAEGKEGKIEVGEDYTYRDFFVPIPEASSFAELNLYLLRQCLLDDQCFTCGQDVSIGQAWQQEQAYLHSLPTFEYDCSVVSSAQLTSYNQIVYETNRYSVPVKRNMREVIVKAYPCHIEIYEHTTLLARHPRCHGSEQDIFEPLHYLPFKPRSGGLPDLYLSLLNTLRGTCPEGRGVQEFVRILQLHQDYSPQIMEVAIEQAIAAGCVHFDGILHCLQQLISLQKNPTSPDFPD